MGSVRASGERIEALRALMDRLGSPDLTLGEAKALRCRLLYLTRPDEDAACNQAPRSATSFSPCEGHQDASCRDCAA